MRRKLSCRRRWITLAAAIATLAATIVVTTYVASPSLIQAQQPGHLAQPLPACNGQAATIVGTSANDTQNGTNNPDVIVLGSGADKSNGLAGNDSICGGSGKDTLSGGNNNDTLLGGTGKDKFHGGPGNDTCIGGAANDTFTNCK
jgi:hypothetical protein